MGFFGAFGKVLAGKPVFEPEQQDQTGQPPARPGELQDDQQTVQEGRQPGVQSEAPQAAPVVRFERVECEGDGERLDVYAETRNESEVPIFVDWVTLCGAKRQLDMQLRPGEVKQLHVYSGRSFTNQPGGYCEVQYRTAQDGDYFMAYHEIRSEPEGAEGYRITELLQRGPVKDIR